MVKKSITGATGVAVGVEVGVGVIDGVGVLVSEAPPPTAPSD